jgi:hypothetical protein
MHYLEEFDWVCSECGVEACRRTYGNTSRVFDVSTFHIDVCAICKEKKSCTEIRDFGYPATEVMREMKNKSVKSANSSTMNYLVFDIDGVLADPSDRLHYITGEKKDWDRFYDEAQYDQPILPNMRLMNNLLETIGANDIIIMTGRPKRIFNETADWLFDYLDTVFVLDKTIFMREDGDHRPDYVLKLEWCEKLGLENIDIVFDDRDQVVKALREAGLNVFQTVDGNY